MNNEQLISEISKILEEKIAPQLAAHGGGASVTNFEDGVAWIKFRGACAGCMSASDTLEQFVKVELMNAFPEIQDVKIDMSVSDDLLDFAKKILRGEMRDKNE